MHSGLRNVKADEGKRREMHEKKLSKLGGIRFRRVTIHELHCWEGSSPSFHFSEFDVLAADDFQVDT